jgi:L-alanine-DL-glutamate epimerase-like enolase superfamily enzyme
LTRNISFTFEPLDLTKTYPFGIAYGSTTDSKNVLVKLSFEGLTGLGEAAPVSYHGEKRETVMAVLSLIKESEEQVFGNDPFAIEEITSRMDKVIAGNYAAKAAIETALHDLTGKLANLPTYKMFGLSGKAYPMTDFTIAIDELSVIEKKTKEAVAAGHKILKVKLGTSYDQQIIELIRKVAPNLPLRVDANGAWTVKEAIIKAEFLAGHNVEFIEQPLPKHSHIEDFRFVKERSPLPIFADESACRAVDVARLAGSVDGVVIKLAKCGGLLEARRMIAVARAHSLKVMFGMMVESSIGVTAAAQLQSLCDYLDLDGALLLKDDPYVGAVYGDGYLRLSEGPGLGVTARKISR